MEHLSNGNLQGWIEKAGTTGVIFPADELWLVFDCLVRACIAMRHPPRYQLPAGGGRPRPPWGGPIPETVPPPGTVGVAHSNIVHFDIDPSNIFVGGFGIGTHVNMPVIKVSNPQSLIKLIPPLVRYQAAT